jgi:hypothetical protein
LFEEASAVLVMLAPLQRRAANRRRKAKERQRRRKGLRRCELWLTDRAVEGLLTQLITDRKLSERTASDFRHFETALARTLNELRDEWRRDHAVEIAELRGQISALLTLLGKSFNVPDVKSADVVELPNWRERHVA